MLLRKLTLSFFVLMAAVACSQTAVSTSNQQLQSNLPPTPSPLPPINTVATAVPTAPPPIAPTALPTAVSTLPPPTFENVQDEMMMETAVSHNATFTRLLPENSGIWQYETDMFVHPVALQIWDGTAYLLDGGRVLAIDVETPSLPRLLLAPGHDIPNADADVGDVRVIEPLDLVAGADGLLVLDRAGDVYRYDWAMETWSLEWYKRPISDTSSHYYVALGAAGRDRYLLETSYKFVVQYADSLQTALWTLPEIRGIDVAVRGEDVFVLTNEMDGTAGVLTLYRATSLIGAFAPTVAIARPRGVAVGEVAVYVLDENGRRLLKLEADGGQLAELYQLPADVSAVTIDPESGAVVLAGRDRLYFYGNPAQTAHVAGGTSFAGLPPHDTDWLAQVDGFISPIGPTIPARDLQMPSAPRHYRLGVHEGSDFYWARGTQVVAVADGVVIRAMHDYVPSFPADFYNRRVESHALGYTSEETLDFYRGQQVWIEHDNGMVSRYTHLSGIDYRIAEGERVEQGQPVGLIGNSGSPGSLESPTMDAHLHFELWRGEGHYIGKFLRPIEAREWIGKILGVE